MEILIAAWDAHYYLIVWASLALTYHQCHESSGTVRRIAVCDAAVILRFLEIPLVLRSFFDSLGSEVPLLFDDWRLLLWRDA